MIAKRLMYVSDIPHAFKSTEYKGKKELTKFQKMVEKGLKGLVKL